MSSTQFFSVVIVIVALAVGCSTEPKPSESQSTDHGHGHANEPTTFKQAVQSLVEQRNVIRDGFASGDIDKAHGPLHEVGHTLEHLVDLAEKEGIKGSDLTAIKQAKETLFDAFDNVDKTLHGGEGSTYEDESETIDTALQTITSIAGVADENVAVPDNDLPAGDEAETADVPAPAAGGGQ